MKPPKELQKKKVQEATMSPSDIRVLNYCINKQAYHTLHKSDSPANNKLIPKLSKQKDI